jgi:CubicO group peptidase (beta-lactamase class C family)
MYAIAGYLGALADGASYDDASLSASYARLMQERLFSRIGMPRATLDFDVAMADADHAGSHSYDGRSRALAAVPIDMERFGGTTAPASSVWADLRDIEAYTSTQLSGVAPGGERIVSRERLDELYTPLIAAGEGQGSALGWFTRELLGLRAISKDGDGLGFTTEVLLLPDADLGVVVLANRVAGQAFYKAVEQFAVETVFSMEHASDAELLAANDDLLSMLRDLAAATSIVSREQAEPYLGRYGDDVRVEFGERGLVLRSAVSEMQLVSLGAPGVFASGGVLNGRFKASFDSDLEPMRLTLDLLISEEGVPQELTLDRTGE